jgi:hypothetical protein
MKRFALHWKDGSIQTISGDSLEDACLKIGYSLDEIKQFKFFKEAKEIKPITDDGAKLLVSEVLMQAANDIRNTSDTKAPKKLMAGSATRFLKTEWFEVLAELAKIDPIVARSKVA